MIILGRTHQERVAATALLASIAVLLLEGAVLSRLLSIEALFGSVLFALLLSLPQLIAATAFVRAKGMVGKMTAAAAGTISWLMGIYLEHDVIVSTSSTAGVAVIFWLGVAIPALGVMLLMATLIDRLIVRQTPG